jgi:hypothetical protein
MRTLFKLCGFISMAKHQWKYSHWCLPLHSLSRKHGRRWESPGLYTYNLCFTWVLFQQYILTVQIKPDLLCASRNFVVECGASVNTPLPLASFVFSNCPIGSVFVFPTFGSMITPPLLGLVTGGLEHFPISLSLKDLASCPSWTSSFAIDWEWEFGIWVCDSNLLKLVNTFSSNVEFLGSGMVDCYCGLGGLLLGGGW